MASQFLDFGTTSINAAAWAQQMACIACIDQVSIEKIDAMLLPGGRRVVTKTNRNTWPPSYVICELGPNDWLIAIEGTTNATQGLYHVWGTFLPEEDERGGYVNGQWLGLSQEISDECMALSDSGPSSVKWRISGHSYGGALASLVAENIKGRRPLWDVQCMAIGTPRPRSGGWNPVGLNAHWRAMSDGDVVTGLPPNGPFPSTVVPSVSPFVVLRQVEWRHYSDPAVIYAGGSIDVPELPPDPLPPNVSVSVIGQHLWRNYYGRLKAHYERFGGPPQFVQALNIMADVLPGGDSLIPVPAMPMAIPLPIGSSVPNPQPFAPAIEPEPEAFRSVLMDPTYLTPGSAWKYTFMFNSDDAAGWSENLFLFSSAANMSLDALRNAGKTLAIQRRGILTSACSLVFVRISRVDRPASPAGFFGRSHLMKGAADGMGPGGKSGVRPDPNCCITFDTGEPSLTFKGKWTVRGLYGDTTSITVGNNRLNEPPTPAVTAWLNQMRGLLSQNGTSSLSNMTIAMKVGNKQDSVAGWKSVSEYRLTDCKLDLVVLGGVPDVAEGDFLQLSHKPQDCVKGLTGLAKILRINTEPGGFTVYTLDMGYCCPPETLALAVGRVRKYVPRFVAITRVSGGVISTRKAGRPFGLRAGKAKAKCC